jgi:hypothetical protein
MRVLLFSVILATSFSQRLYPPNTSFNHLQMAVENASRFGQIVWVEEFSGLT